jgi:hypothetical protein
MAVFSAIVAFCFLIGRFRNRDLVSRVGKLLAENYGTRQATYDQRRLRRKGLIAKIPKTHCYRLTRLGRRVSVIFTRAYERVLAPGLSALDSALPEDVAARTPLAMTWRQFENTLEQFLDTALVAAKT